MSVHFMDSGVDTGDILRIERVPIEPPEDIQRLRDRFEPAMCRLMVEVCIDSLQGRAPRVPQDVAAGRQYFSMHSRLVRLTEGKLRQVS
jgi:methionyl-tRNA formyltransferase